MKMPVKDPSKKPSSRKTPDLNRCAFETSDGRRCRLARSTTHGSLCVFHSRDERQLLEAEKLGSEIACPLTRDFLTATDINHVLGKLFTAVAQNRFPARTAHTLAYIAQLMLFSVPAIKRATSLQSPDLSHAAFRSLLFTCSHQQEILVLSPLECAVEHPMKDASPACPVPDGEGASQPKDSLR